MKLIYFEEYNASLGGWTVCVERAESLGHWLSCLDKKRRSNIVIKCELTARLKDDKTMKLRGTK